MKIAFLTPYLSTGGAERALINIAHYFFSKGIEVQMVAGKVVGEQSKILDDGIKLIHLHNPEPLDKPAFYANTKALVLYLKQEKPDAVISNSDYLNVALVLARKISKHRCKIIISQQYHLSSFLKELPPANKYFIKQIQRFVARKADAIIGASQGVIDDFAQQHRLPISNPKLKTIYNPVYEPGIEMKAAMPVDDPAFGKGALKLITVGRLVKQKNHASLLRAFALVARQIQDIQLYIIGIGVEEVPLKQLAEQLGIDAQITFLGYQQNPYAYVSKCDLFVLSSVYEGFGNVIVEALATGTNVVSTDCPSGPSEILGNGHYGWLCPVQDAQKLSSTIIAALEMPKPAILLKERAKLFGTEIMAQQYLDTVKALLVANFHP